MPQPLLPACNLGISADPKSCGSPAAAHNVGDADNANMGIVGRKMAEGEEPPAAPAEKMASGRELIKGEQQEGPGGSG
jgi:hypothetical protein